jgi:leucyl-tRNA synthetase
LELHGIFGFAFDIVQVTQSLTVFTTRPDTLYGVTAVVLAPENTTLDAYIPASHKSNVDAYRSETAKKTAVERQQNEKEKTGVFAGMYLAHPFTGENVPVWFADYVLPDYATGAVMFVPAHDERDFEFAQKQDLRIKVVIEGPESSDAEEDIDEAYTCYT